MILICGLMLCIVCSSTIYCDKIEITRRTTKHSVGCCFFVHTSNWTATTFIRQARSHCWHLSYTQQRYHHLTFTDSIVFTSISIQKTRKAFSNWKKKEKNCDFADHRRRCCIKPDIKKWATSRIGKILKLRPKVCLCKIRINVDLHWNTYIPKGSFNWNSPTISR